MTAFKKYCTTFLFKMALLYKMIIFRSSSTSILWRRYLKSDRGCTGVRDMPCAAPMKTHQFGQVMSL